MSEHKEEDVNEEEEINEEVEGFEIDDDATEGEDTDKEEEKKEDATFNQTAETEEKSSHKKYKKHSLSYDSIFKGKKETLDEDNPEDCMLVPDRIEIMQGTIVYEEARNPEEYHRLQKLTTTVYDILLNKTELNFKKNRRKPSPKDFNRYFEIIKDNVNDNSFSDCEIFVELAFYFSENLFNMFKLLDPEKGSKIMNELKEYMNKKNGSDLDNIDFI